MPRIKLFSSDLNGTLVQQHTMSDMIRLYIGERQYQQANEVFKRQTSGTASMEEAFETAGPLTRGLTLRQAIEYTITPMKYVDGFHEFVEELSYQGISLVINSTGYSVTIYAIKKQLGAGQIQGYIGNALKFGMDANPQSTLTEEELEMKVEEYFSHPTVARDSVYDQIQATGVIDLGIANEEAKAKLIGKYAQTCFLKDILLNEIAHMGDTMGDSGGIVGIAKSGGMGIAFNYNESLERFLNEKIVRRPSLQGGIYFIDKKGEKSDLRHVLPLVLT